MGGNVYIYIVVMSLVSFAVRVLPLTLIRGQIKSVFVRSFLHYVPYVTLAVMPFPAIVEATQLPAAGVLALGVGALLAWRGAGLLPVAACCCLTVLAAEGILL